MLQPQLEHVLVLVPVLELVLLLLPAGCVASVGKYVALAGIAVHSSYHSDGVGVMAFLAADEWSLVLCGPD
jgi:hypothetical protein